MTDITPDEREEAIKRIGQREDLCKAFFANHPDLAWKMALETEVELQRTQAQLEASRAREERLAEALEKIIARVALVSPHYANARGALAEYQAAKATSTPAPSAQPPRTSAPPTR